jgi:hypothetical protein
MIFIVFIALIDFQNWFFKYLVINLIKYYHFILLQQIMWMEQSIQQEHNYLS